MDDLVFTGNCKKMMIHFKELMNCEFDMSDLVKLRYFMGVRSIAI